MTTATLVLLAALTLIFNPVRVLAILMLLALLYFNPIPSVITLFFFGDYLLLNQEVTTMSTYENQLLDAVEAVSARDLPEEDFADAVNAQARLMCGIPSDELWRFDSETPIH
jgi:hypothetical protein